MGFSDPLGDIQVEVRHATLLPALRTPGFALPGTFPSRCFSHPQGFTPSPFISRLSTPNKSTLWQFCFALPPPRISSTNLKGLQDKSGASRLWHFLPFPKAEAFRKQRHDLRSGVRITISNRSANRGLNTASAKDSGEDPIYTAATKSTLPRNPNPKI
jgi:hypothetical protein